jgi:transposase
MEASEMKRNRWRKTSKSRQSPSLLERINPDVAGIDLGSSEHFVAVPADRDPNPVQSFRTFTSDLHRLADWLTACRIRSVVMEATGVYWIPIFEILEARGFDVLLVNARHVRNVPGRKSDVRDCEWLRDLHIVGLLRGSFRPADAIVALRGYMRHRDTLVKSMSTVVQRMQKALTQMNVQLPLVIGLGHFARPRLLRPRMGRRAGQVPGDQAPRPVGDGRLTARRLGQRHTRPSGTGAVST